MKHIYWDKKKTHLGEIGEETALIDTTGKKLAVGDIVNCRIKGDGFRNNYPCVVVISDITGYPCLWGFASKTETPEKYAEFLELMTVTFDVKHTCVVGTEPEFSKAGLSVVNRDS